MAMRRLWSLVAGLALLAGPAAFAQTGAPKGGMGNVDTAAEWLELPTWNDLGPVWPQKALETGVSGRASIRCTVTVTGLLTACKVLSETPVDYGFGAAALLASPSFLFKPATHNGVPIVSTAIIPVNFSNPNGQDAYGDPISVIPWYPWLKAPSAADVSAAYPAAAVAKAPHGHVVLRCGFNKRDATLTSCEAVTEAPLGKGFARSALALSKQFQGRPGLLPPQKLGATYINLAIDFQPPSLQNRYINQPDWTRTLNPAHAAALFPARAVDAKLVKGQATVDCLIDEVGGLTQCQVAREAPTGLDFGLSAITAAQAMRVNLWTRDGAPTPGAHIRLPMTLVYAGDTPAPRPDPAAAPPAAPPDAKPAKAS
jgi:protein TonB